jgi:hypothetical protein
MFKTANAVQIKISIDEIQPDVWRRLVLPVYWNLEHLHLGIQAAFNWWNYHLYEFRIGGLRHGDVEILTEDATDDDPRVFDQNRGFGSRLIDALSSGQLRRGQVDLNYGVSGVRCVLEAPLDTGWSDQDHIQSRL